MAAEVAALERSALEEEVIRCVAEVRAMQLAPLTVHSNKGTDLTEQAPKTQTSLTGETFNGEGCNLEIPLEGVLILMHQALSHGV